MIGSAAANQGKSLTQILECAILVSNVYCVTILSYDKTQFFVVDSGTTHAGKCTRSSKIPSYIQKRYSYPTFTRNGCVRRRSIFFPPYDVNESYSNITHFQTTQ